MDAINSPEEEVVYQKIVTSSRMNCDFWRYNVSMLGRWANGYPQRILRIIIKQDYQVAVFIC